LTKDSLSYDKFIAYLFFLKLFFIKSNGDTAKSFLFSKNLAVSLISYSCFIFSCILV
jgi:hypothetical protein